MDSFENRTARYSKYVDEAWVRLSALGAEDVAGSVQGACERCGHVPSGSGVVSSDMIKDGFGDKNESLDLTS